MASNSDLFGQCDLRWGCLLRLLDHRFRNFLRTFARGLRRRLGSSLGPVGAWRQRPTFSTVILARLWGLLGKRVLGLRQLSDKSLGRADVGRMNFESRSFTA